MLFRLTDAELPDPLEILNTDPLMLLDNKTLPTVELSIVPILSSEALLLPKDALFTSPLMVVLILAISAVKFETVLIFVLILFLELLDVVDTVP